MLQVYRTSSIDWKPSPVVALATSIDDTQVAAAREDGSLEIWLVSPGSVGWHCQLTMHGNPESRVSSLVWCRSGLKGMPCGRLFSSSIDGSVSEWDLFDLKQKIVLDTIGVSIWQMALAPYNSPHSTGEHVSQQTANGHLDYDVENGECGTSESEDDDETLSIHTVLVNESPCVAIGCDDGCVRLYRIPDSDDFSYYKSLPRVSGRVLSVTWNCDATLIFAGSSDGLIRCWDVSSVREKYRITVGQGGIGNRRNLCIWSLLALRCGTIVSADSSGSVQFWDCRHGTLLQAHSFHKGDVNALAAAPGHHRVFSAGSDGQIILYKLSSNRDSSSAHESYSGAMKKWVYVGYVRAHTHDVRALTVAVPISREDPLPEEKVKRVRAREKPLEFSYNKWAHLGVPMLISAGDDTKLFAYSAMEFTKFSPHDICPAPQRVPIQLVLDSIFNKRPLLLVQASYWLDILCLNIKGGSPLDTNPTPSGSLAATELLARVKSKASKKIICSAISSSGKLFSYSDHVKPSLFELKKSESGKSAWTVAKKQLPRKLPYAHSMVFSADSSRLMIAGHDGRIYIVDLEKSEIVHSYTPCREALAEPLLPQEPPITKIFTSSDGQWLAAINCFGDMYIFNLEIQRQHWFISRLDGASVTSGGFSPHNSNVLIVTISSNQVYAFDVEAKQLGKWSMRNTFSLPRRFQEFPGEVTGLSFPPCTSSSSSVIVYSARAMCLIDFGMPADLDSSNDPVVNGPDSASKKLQKPLVNGEVKRKLKDRDLVKVGDGRKNFDFCAFRDPVLFVGHLSRSSVLVIDKRWMDVVRSFDAPPVHRHIFGT